MRISESPNRSQPARITNPLGSAVESQFVIREDGDVGPRHLRLLRRIGALFRETFRILKLAAVASVKSLRRLSLETLFWAAMALLIVLYVIVLLTQATGVGRGGR